MKVSRPAILLLLLISLASFSTEVSGESLVNSLTEMLKTSLPCAAPCVLRNLTEILNDVVTNCHLADFLSTDFSQYSSISGFSDWAQLNRQNICNKGVICEHVKVFAQCSVSQLQAYCGSDLTHALAKHINRMFAYYGCGNSTEGLVLQCLVHEGVDAAVENCVNIVLNTDGGQILLTHDYNHIYNELLTQTLEAPKICQVIETFTGCLYGQLESLCGLPITQQTKDEISHALDLINCNDPFDITKDGLTCLGKPELQEKIGNCITASVVEHNLDFLDLDPDTGLPEIVLSKACDFLMHIMDICILDEMVMESQCQANGWTLELYSEVVTPLRDFLLTECPGLEQLSANSEGDSQVNSKGNRKGNSEVRSEVIGEDNGESNNVCSTLYEDYP